MAEVKERSSKYKNNLDYPQLVDAVVKIEQEISSIINTSQDSLSKETQAIDIHKL